MEYNLLNNSLENEEYIVIYKPHAALGTRNADAKEAHMKIMQMISQSENGHYMGEEDINDVFTLVDFSFFDNTSVMIDYLHTNKPAAIHGDT